MIPRYTRPDMGRIWTDENKFQKWLDVEIATAEVEAEAGLIPKSAARAIRKKARFEVDRILEIERQVKHDVIAFTTNVAEHVGREGRYLHYGLTSNDVVDTAQALQVREASALLLAGLNRLGEVLKRRALEFKHTPMIGRTHGIHAEPITFGCKLAVWYAENQRNTERLGYAAEQMRVGKISGAVGTYTHLPPAIERGICERLGLEPAPVSTQVIQRDRHAFYLSTLAVAAASLEKIALEVRGLQRTEVREVEEYFSPEQKGSSAMPHKRNPITAEQICGLARVVRCECPGGARKCGALARAGHLALFRRARDSCRFHHSSRLPSCQDREPGGKDVRVSRPHAGEPGPVKGFDLSPGSYCWIWWKRERRAKKPTVGCSAMPCKCGKRARTIAPSWSATMTSAGTSSPAKLPRSSTWSAT